jgi:hypothetical protein
MQRPPNAYAKRRSTRRRRPVESTNTGDGAGMTITSVSGMSQAAVDGFFGSREVTSRA